jgi:hypothetical protein
MSLIEWMAETEWWLDADFQDESGRIKAVSPDGSIIVTQTDEGNHWQVCQYDKAGKGVLVSKANFSHCGSQAIISFIKYL